MLINDCSFSLAAKKARKKDLAKIDHRNTAYEPFQKAFYHPPSDVADMTDAEAEELRDKLDNIKIRGADCPNPVTKWSYCGLPANW